MSIKGLAAKLFAKTVHAKNQKWMNNPVETQQKVLESLLLESKSTLFGQNHNFLDIKSHNDFVQNVPVRDYEDLKIYIDKAVKGEENILWKGKPLYFAKTSGTTSGAKYIPLTKE